jgi:hypothetical protein
MVNWFAMAHDFRKNHHFTMGLFESRVDGFERGLVIARGWF